MACTLSRIFDTFTYIFPPLLQYYASIGGITLEEMNRLEAQWLRDSDWDVHVDVEEYEKYAREFDRQKVCLTALFSFSLLIPIAFNARKNRPSTLFSPVFKMYESHIPFFFKYNRVHGTPFNAVCCKNIKQRFLKLQFLYFIGKEPKWLRSTKNFLTSLPNKYGTEE